MLKEYLVVICLMLAVVAAYPSDEAKSDGIEQDSNVEDLGAQESRYFGFARGIGGFGHNFGGFGFGRHAFGGHGFRYFG